MAPSYVESIFNNKSNVHIRDIDKVNKILDNIIKGGFQKLQVVSDFDQTISKQHENNKKLLSTFGVLKLCPSIPPKVSEEGVALTNKYVPIEYDPHLSMAEKSKHMEEWYSATANLLRGIKIDQEEIAETSKKIGPPLREGTDELFASLNEMNVPILVFSAGVGDVIEAILKENNVYFPTIKVIANFIKYNEQGVTDGFKHKLIHVLNKNQTALKDFGYFDALKERENVILLGDSTGDVDMADGMPHSNVLKIGFLYNRIEESLPVYMENYDIVLADDQTMDIPRAIVDLIE